MSNQPINVDSISTDINTALKTAENTVNTTMSIAANVMTGVDNVFNLVNKIQNKFTGVAQCEEYTKQTMDGVTKMQQVLDQQNKAFSDSLKVASQTLDSYQNEAGQLLLKQNRQMDQIQQNSLIVVQQQQQAEQYKNELIMVNSQLDEDQKRLNQVVLELNQCNEVFSYKVQIVVGFLLFAISTLLAYLASPHKKEQFAGKKNKLTNKTHTQVKLQSQHQCPC